MKDLIIYLLSIFALFGTIVTILFVSDWAEKVKPKSDTHPPLTEQKIKE